jgi:hypothetical protein
VLFTLGNLQAGSSLSSLLTDDEDSLYPEVYAEGFKNEKIDFVPFPGTEPVAEGIEVMLTPNPFSDYAVLRVVLPEGGRFGLSIYDMRGVELFARQYETTLSEAQVVISPEMVGAPGVYYYKVKSALGELSGKFVRQ